jgi:hypothetical protein
MYVDTNTNRAFAVTLLLLLVPVVLYNGVHNGCNAKKIDSYDLLIGDWETSVRLEGRLNHRSSNKHPLLEIFSTTTSTGTGAITDTHNNVPHPPQPYGWLLNPWKLCRNQRRPQQQPYTYSRNIPCRLSLYPNGTFGLTDHTTIISSCDANNSIKQNQKQQPQETLSSSFLIRGKWTLQSNPYCVTDRFYDDILLESYPRVLKELRMVPNATTTTTRSKNIHSVKDTDVKYQSVRSSSSSSIIQPIQKVQLKIHCRLSGHFNGKPHTRPYRWQQILPYHPQRDRNSYYYARGKMTHGVMTLDELYNTNHRNTTNTVDTTLAGMSSPFRTLQQQLRVQPYRNRYTKQIVASFSARRLIPNYSDLFSQSIESYDDLDTL